MKNISMLILSIALLPAVAQIPNPSFESWGALDPVGWQTSNNTTTGSATKVTQAHDGSAAVKIQPVSFQGFTVPPVLVSPANNKFFPYAGKPAALNGWYMASFANNDIGFVTGSMQKNHSTIGGGAITISSGSSVYKQFSMPFTYTGTASADSASILFTISNSNGATGLSTQSYLIIDDLSYGSAGTPTGLREDAPGVSVMCSAAEGMLTIYFKTEKYGPVTVALYDISGKLVKEFVSGEQEAGTYRLKESTGDLQAGMYIVRLASDGALYSGKAIIAH